MWDTGASADPGGYTATSCHRHCSIAGWGYSESGSVQEAGSSDTGEGVRGHKCQPEDTGTPAECSGQSLLLQNRWLQAIFLLIRTLGIWQKYIFVVRAG